MYNKLKLFFIIIFIGPHTYAQSYTPIGTVNPNDYEPRQKLISEGNQSINALGVPKQKKQEKTGKVDST